MSRNKIGPDDLIVVSLESGGHALQAPDGSKYPIGYEHGPRKWNPGLKRYTTAPAQFIAVEIDGKRIKDESLSVVKWRVAEFLNDTVKTTGKKNPTRKKRETTTPGGWILRNSSGDVYDGAYANPDAESAMRFYSRQSANNYKGWRGLGGDWQATRFGKAVTVTGNKNPRVSGPDIETFTSDDGRLTFDWRSDERHFPVFVDGKEVGILTRPLVYDRKGKYEFVSRDGKIRTQHSFIGKGTPNIIWRRLQGIVPGGLRVSVTGDKNPTQKFGKRKVTPAKPAKRAAKKAPTFGRRKIAPKKAIADGRTVHAIAAYEKGKDGERWYYDGVALNSDREKAAIYTDWRQAERVLESIENKLPARVRAASVIAVTWL